MTTLREAAQQALEALELGYDSAKAEADQYHAAMAGYRPQRHAQMDADVQQIAAAITALKAALAKPCPCGDRPAAQCPGEWDPGCDFGNNPKYAKRVEMTPKELAASIKRGDKWKVAEPVHEPVADRTAFERHAERLGYSVDPDTREGREGGYWSSHTQLMWLTWQAALAEPVQGPVCAHGVGKTKCSFCSVEDKQPVQEPEPGEYHGWVLREVLFDNGEPVGHREPVQEPVAGRAFFERILAAMEGVIDVADRKTDEFDALRSCVIDLTLMLHTTPPQRKPLSDVDLAKIWDDALDQLDPRDQLRFIARAIERAHGITS